MIVLGLLNMESLSNCGIELTGIIGINGLNLIFIFFIFIFWMNDASHLLNQYTWWCNNNIVFELMGLEYYGIVGIN